MRQAVKTRLKKAHEPADFWAFAQKIEGRAI
jgi:hypothetical protein